MATTAVPESRSCGAAFDPRSYDRYERLAQSPAEREPGGFGLLLAQARLDSFDYRYERGRNCNVLIMRRR